MYTKCPKCRAAYRVTAPVLQQARGRVRCGGCGNSFSAIDFLSEDLPDANTPVDTPAGEPGRELAAEVELSETGRLLLNTLDELAGSGDVRIEDTGTEWRVLDGDYEDNQAGDADGAQSSLDLQDPVPAAARGWRFDDNAPDPEGIVSEEPDEGTPEFEQPLTGLALSEPGEWADLLEEVREGAAALENMPFVVTGSDDDIEAADDEAEIEADAEVTGSDDESPAEEAEIVDDETEIDAEAEATDSEDESPAEEVAATAKDEPQDFTAALARLNDPAKLFDDDSLEVETIIMEGETVRNAIEEMQLQAENEAEDRFGPTGSLFDTYASSRAMPGERRSTEPLTKRRVGVIAGSVLLALLLAGQVIHAYRETLSTYALFDQTIGPVYRLLGRPVTPEWNIKGWQFEETNGSIADGGNVLTILSRIGNNSQSPLPYPLVHVSLTDRFEEIVGSRVLTPDEYLAGDLDPGRPVIPGENFTAVITIDEPSADATGFKLNVCYRDVPGKVRCATEDFKD